MNSYDKVGDVQGMSAMPMGRQKEGHSCCGCCCDTRRATIIVDIVMICIMVLGTLEIYVGVEFIQAAAENGDDDKMDELNKQLQSIPLGLLLFLNTVLIVMFACGVQGAVSYSPKMVKIAVAGYAIKMALDLFGLNILGVIVAGSFLYPHIYFLKEMKANIMTPDNYPYEAQCCC